MTTPNEAPDIVGLRALLAKATRGPWRETNGYYREIQGSPRPCEKYGDMVTTHTGAIAKQQGYGRDNAKLIVAAANALPSILDELEALRAARDEWTIERAVGQQQLDAMAAENGRLLEALEPFAAYRGSDEYIKVAADYSLCRAVSFKVEDYRRARAALAHSKGEG